MDDCIDHGRRKGKFDYSYKWRNGKQYPAHRLVYADTHGLDVSTMPFDQVVRHICDNKRCINPNHLIIGSRHDNSTDMVLRGRTRSRLTQNDVLQILKSATPVSVLAEKYDVSRSTIRRIKSKQTHNFSDQKSETAIKLKACGEKNGNSVLTKEEADQIMGMKGSQRQIAKKFGVSQYTVWAIKSGKTWKEK